MRAKVVFKPGARVVFVCEGKAECGITGTVTDFRPYGGPRMYADLEYRIVDCLWHGQPTGPMWVRETWVELIV